MASEETGSKTGTGKPKKRVAALRRPSADLLANPAMAGVRETVNRSFIGQGAQLPGPSPAGDAESAVEPPASSERSNEAGPSSATGEHTLAAAAGTEPSGPAQAPSRAEGAPSVPAAADSSKADRADDEPPAKSRGGAPEVAPATRGSLLAAGDTEAAPAERQPARSRAASKRRSATALTEVRLSYTESVLDLALAKREWAAHPFRFTPDQIHELNRRVAQDSATSDLPLTSAQYVNAAMARHLPADLDAQLQLAEAFLRDNATRRIPEGKQSSYRVSPDVLKVVRPLSNHLKLAGRARTGYHIYAAVLAAFLAELRHEGPLHPEV